jgi:hypothetical protein
MTDHRGDGDLAELATGAVAGAERARALHHVVACGRCLQELSQLSRAADELLTLAPGQEPPAGFESSVIARMLTERTTTRRPQRGRLLLSLATVLLAAAFGAAAVWQLTAADREAADEQRTIMAIGGGTRMTALPIVTDAGTRAGTIFLFEGNLSWMMVSLADAPADGAYSMVLYDHSGAAYAGNTCDVHDGVAVDGYWLYRPAGAIASVELVGPGGVHLTARVTAR